MVHLTKCSDPFSLDDLAARIRKSSNFRFAWQFYQCSGIDPQSPASVRQALETIIATPELAFAATDAREFEIEPVHEHCRVDAATDEFEQILARAAGDHLGAYSRDLRDASRIEKDEISRLFQSIGEYRAFELLPGNVPDCDNCGMHDSHIFSSWFFNVAWDWCLFALWPRRNLLWIGCLTDTD